VQVSLVAGETWRLRVVLNCNKSCGIYGLLIFNRKGAEGRRRKGKIKDKDVK
jgi:hypothetical protein